MEDETFDSNRGLRTLVGILVCMAAVMMSGIVHGEGMTDSASSRPMKITDNAITVAVESRFFVDPGIPADRIDVYTKDGVVVLSGVVPHLLARERAVNTAKTIKGVRSVIDELVVKPEDIPESGILQNRIMKSLRGDPAIHAEDLRVRVTSQREAILDGTVDSSDEKNLVDQVVKFVKGVTEVQNRLRIRQSATRSDQEIEEEIFRRMQMDPWLDESLIGMMVENGTVTLTGTVGSAKQRDRAELDAWVTGVQAVNVDQLEVRWWAFDKMRKSSPGEIDDQYLAHFLREALGGHPRTRNLGIKVMVDKGLATLSGTVDNLLAKRQADHIVQNTVGVLRVRNLLKVRPADSNKDTRLIREATKALSEHPFTDRYDIAVTARDQTVFLHGFVDSDYTKKQVERVVSSVAGVVSVKNHITVSPPSTTGDSDEKLFRKIKQNFWWNSYIPHQQIRVDVKAGVVTLQGQVAYMQQRRLAESLVRQAGARTINNRLKVKFAPEFRTASLPAV